MKFNSFTSFLIYLVSLTLLFIDVCVSASFGNYIPFLLFFVFFFLAFSILGCLKISFNRSNFLGFIFTNIISFSLLIYGIASIKLFSIGLHIILAIVMVIMSILALKEKETSH